MFSTAISKRIRFNSLKMDLPYAIMVELDKFLMTYICIINKMYLWEDMNKIK